MGVSHPKFKGYRFWPAWITAGKYSLQLNEREADLKAEWEPAWEAPLLFVSTGG